MTVRDDDGGCHDFTLCAAGHRRRVLQWELDEYFRITSPELPHVGTRFRFPSPRPLLLPLSMGKAARLDDRSGHDTLSARGF